MFRRLLPSRLVWGEGWPQLYEWGPLQVSVDKDNKLTHAGLSISPVLRARKFTWVAHLTLNRYDNSPDRDCC